MGEIINKLIVLGQKKMFFLRIKCRLVRKSENLNICSLFFINFLLPLMLKFTIQFTLVHLFTCVAKAVTSRRSRGCSIISSGCEVLSTVHIHRHRYIVLSKLTFHNRLCPKWAGSIWSVNGLSVLAYKLWMWKH